jgi:hypothetical protein
MAAGLIASTGEFRLSAILVVTETLATILQRVVLVAFACLLARLVIVTVATTCVSRAVFEVTLRRVNKASNEPAFGLEVGGAALGNVAFLGFGDAGVATSDASLASFAGRALLSHTKAASLDTVIGNFIFTSHGTVDIGRGQLQWSMLVLLLARLTTIAGLGCHITRLVLDATAACARAVSPVGPDLWHLTVNRALVRVAGHFVCALAANRRVVSTFTIISDRATGFSAMRSSCRHLASASLLSCAALLVASSEAGPGREFAVHGTGLSVALLHLALRPAFLATS